MEGIIYRHGIDDFEYWVPDLPKEAMMQIEKILDQYGDTGYSVRGTRNDIKDEL